MSWVGEIEDLKDGDKSGASWMKTCCDGAQLFKDGDIASATKSYTDALALIPLPDRKSRATVLLNRALVRLKVAPNPMAFPGAACRNAEHPVTVRRSSSLIYNFARLCTFPQGKMLQQAAVDADAALALVLTPRGLYIRGRVLHAMNDLYGAISFCKRAADLASDDGTLQTHLDKVARSPPPRRWTPERPAPGRCGAPTLTNGGRGRRRCGSTTSAGRVRGGSRPWCAPPGTAPRPAGAWQRRRQRQRRPRRLAARARGRAGSWRGSGGRRFPRETSSSSPPSP
jgi:hypothetical protein